jgi:hypothetical protein
LRIWPALILTLSLAWPVHSAVAFTDKQIRQVFDILDSDHHGKVTRIDFETNKMTAFYFNRRPDASGGMKPMTFAETGLSRQFFDEVDQGHKGYLDPIDIIDGIRFEDIDRAHRGYFDYADLAAFMRKIGR